MRAHRDRRSSGRGTLARPDHAHHIHEMRLMRHLRALVLVTVIANSLPVQGLELGVHSSQDGNHAGRQSDVRGFQHRPGSGRGG